MSTSWRHDDDATPIPRDVIAMAEVLEGRHGVHAAAVADFFSTHHSISGDTGRCWAWAGVAEAIRRRDLERMQDTPASLPDMDVTAFRSN
jgi:hypothetical protein